MKNALSKLEQMGMAALMPGMTYMLEQMQRSLNEFRDALAAAQQADIGDDTPPLLLAAPKRRGRPPGIKNRSGTLRNGWPADPAERKAEMRRRMGVAAGLIEPQKGGRKPGKVYVGSPTHPRHPDHPDHEAWVKKMGRAQRKYWRGLTEAQRQDRILRIGGARIKKSPQQIRVAV